MRYPGYGRPTFSSDFSEISEAFRNSRKSGNIFPDFREFRKIFDLLHWFRTPSEYNIGYGFFFIVDVRRKFQKRRGSRSCIPKRVTKPSEILGSFRNFGTLPKFRNPSENLGSFRNFGTLPKFRNPSENFGTLPKFRNPSENFGTLPKISEPFRKFRNPSEISEVLEKRMESIKHLQASPTDLRALKLDHEAIHGLPVPRRPLVPCVPWVSCPVMHTKSTLETSSVQKKDRYLLRRLRPGSKIAAGCWPSILS